MTAAEDASGAPRGGSSLPTQAPELAALPWQRAWTAAARAFSSRDEGAPAHHFATAANDGDAMARLVMTVLAEVDDALGRPARLDLVDAGCGRGELLAEVHRRLGSRLAAERDWGTRLRLTGVDVRRRPADLPRPVAWVRGEAPAAVPDGVVGVLLAHELLDDLPCEVVQLDGAGELREVLVTASGAELLGAPLRAADPRTRWLARWWPLAAPGARAEIGLARDHAAVGLASRLAAGVLVVVDYAHARDERAGDDDPAARKAGDADPAAAPRWRHGSLTGYLSGRRVAPVPDGSMNLTAHVALDSCAAALVASSPHDDVRLTTVAAAAAAVAAHDVDATTPPTTSTLARAAQDSRWRALRDPDGYGGFGWLTLRRGHSGSRVTAHGADIAPLAQQHGQ